MDEIKEIIERAEKAEENLRLVEKEITVDLLTSKFTYDDKDALLTLRDNNNLRGYTIQSCINKALKILKERKYPEINGVKYFKKYIEQLNVELTEEEKKQLDDELMRNARPNYCRTWLSIDGFDRDKMIQVIKELYEMKVVAPLFEFWYDCDNCGNESSLVIGNVARGESLLDVLERYDGKKCDVKEHLEEMYFECDSCSYYVENEEERLAKDIQEQFDKLSLSYFKIIVEPDTTIDCL